MPRAVFLRLIRAVQTVRDPVTAADWRCWRYWRGTGTLSYWEEEHSATPELVSLQVSLRCYVVKTVLWCRRSECR